jgi:hypothetical protein
MITRRRREGTTAQEALWSIPRSASIGSTLAACRAGIQLAPKATISNSTPAPRRRPGLSNSDLSSSAGFARVACEHTWAFGPAQAAPAQLSRVTLCSRSLGTPTGPPRRSPFSAGLSCLSILVREQTSTSKKEARMKPCTVNDNAQDDSIVQARHLHPYHREDRRRSRRRRAALGQALERRTCGRAYHATVASQRPALHRHQHSVAVGVGQRTRLRRTDLDDLPSGRRTSRPRPQGREGLASRLCEQHHAQRD